ncbi:MAG: sulfur oxidation c-type cytochrome SoxA [Methyloligellaceae bacterium]
MNKAVSEIQPRFRFSIRHSLIPFILISLVFLPVSVFAEEKKEQPVKPDDKDHPLQEIWSGIHYAAPDVKSLQADPAKNPGYAWILRGAELWKTPDGEQKKSCSSCHNKAEVSMKGVGTRYPLFYEAKGALINLEDRVNLCRRKFMKAPLFSKESEELLALTAYVKNQSLGTPLKVKIQGPTKPFFDKGKKLYYTRRGQLNLSCANCHEQNAGKNLRSTTLTQGHSNGYPAYRLSWEKVGSLGRRINTCNSIIRATPLFSDDIKSLELYLAWRGKGLPVETPAVRP